MTDIVFMRVIGKKKKGSIQMTIMHKRGTVRTMLISILIALIIVVTAAPQAMAASGSTKKMTVYTDVIKKGNTVYCAASSGVYKAKLKNNKVVSKKRLARAYYGVRDMKVKSGYLYYRCPYPVGETLYRINLKTGKDEAVFAPEKGRFKNSYSVSVLSYAFKGNKLYAKIEYNDSKDNFHTKTFVAKLNGKASKVTSVKLSNKSKRTNKKGYKIVEKESDDGGRYIARSYLKTPKGKYYLGKCELI